VHEDAVDRYLRQNRACWDELAALHVGTAFYRTADFLRGDNILDEVVRSRLGDVAGKRVLHLQCHIGLDTLCVARMGALATGLDFSPKALAIARDLSEKSGVPAEFIEADVLDAPEELRDFDLVFASWGAICWVPDMRRWMHIVARSLKRGGRLLLVEGHPALLMLDDKGPSDAPFTVGYPYSSKEPIRDESQGSYADPSAHRESPLSYSWQHGIGTIINAAVKAGFQIERFEELDRIPWHGLPQLIPEGGTYWVLPKDATPFPLSYALFARLR
jgi:SAM-dependent methyltransferase